MKRLASYDPHDFDGYVTKHGSIFKITSRGTNDGSKNIKLTDENKHLVFPNIVKAADYVQEKYGDWAMFHYLKNRPGAL